MKKSGAFSMLLWLLVAVTSLFAFHSVAQSTTSELGNLLTRADSIEQQQDNIIRIVPELARRPMSVNRYNNFLFTGQTLRSGDTLEIGRYVLTMQEDCNLVLKEIGVLPGILFTTNTAGKGTNCTLSFMDDGRLIVFSYGANKTLWTSPNHSYPNGSYVAILRPNGELAIYGPAGWTRPVLRTPNAHVGEHLADFALQNVGWPLIRNVLFSGQSLRDGQALRIPNFKFGLNRCNLALIFTVRNIKNWESKTTSDSQSCFVTLSDHGQLSIINDSGEYVWNNTAEPLRLKGEYALVLYGGGDFANVVIYGRKAWSTASNQAE